MKAKNCKSFNELDIKLFNNNTPTSFSEILLSKNRSFKFELVLDGQEASGQGIRGDDAIWLPMGACGVKIFSENKSYDNLDISLVNLNRIKESNSSIFPAIDWVDEFNYGGQRYVAVKMENIRPKKKFKVGTLSWQMPQEDKEFAENMLEVELPYASFCINEFYDLLLKPEDEWYKSINMISGVIVDFHRFSFFPDRYKFKSNGKTKEELDKIYKKMIDRYKTVIDHNKQPKWKGKIYQGFEFDNGYDMIGYSSDNKTYDSYKKLPFIPYGKVKGKKVLDIGSNQGFFSFQAAIHGALSVTGVELQREDVQAANDIKEILQFDNVKFVNGDAVKYIMETEEKYGLVMANSVLHQIYRNLEGVGPLLDKISSMTEYFAFETPVRHPTTTIGLLQIYEKLSKHFKIVRLLYFYDAYSSGYRANFVCYS
tara:strand:+ start:4485 stop:5762 length:1278 start_codon:yes stop_codon:yes gene_type:complete